MFALNCSFEDTYQFAAVLRTLNSKGIVSYE